MTNSTLDLCSCGSGLRAVRCCAWDPATAAPPEADRALQPLVDRALALKSQRDPAEARSACRDVLELSPGNVSCLVALADLMAGETLNAARALLRRAVALDVDNLAATCELALLLFRSGNLAEAEVHARNSVRLAPENAQSHNLMGMILTGSNRPQAGEYHYRRALDLAGTRPDVLLANLALNLKNQGRIAEARALYSEVEAGNPAELRHLLGHARLEEADRNLTAASEILDRCEAIRPGDSNTLLQRAILFGRAGAFDRAIKTLDTIAGQRPENALGPSETLEKGRLLDRLGRYNEAFRAFEDGKRLARTISGQAYQGEQASHLVRRLKAFFTRSRVGILPRARSDGGALPIFVVGFPRSGTTLVEQMLSGHSQISAGDELPFVNELSAIMPRLLASPLTYPDALAELWMGDRRDGLDDLRDHYLRQARRYGVIEDGAAWFTDKMPLNETHLGLIHLIFPEAPIIHVLRHPLDVVLSVFSNELTHGFHCALSLETAARHYALIFDLVEHYKAELPLNYKTVRYDDVVAMQRKSLEAMFDFVGVGFEEQCLRFQDNKRYARTASYAQVTERLYDRSIGRYRHYLDHLKPIIPILRPAIERLGYATD